MDFSDRACDLECVKKAPPRHEFVGPVKIVLIEPLPEDYTRKALGSALLSIAMLLMGAVVFTVFFFTLTFKLDFPENVHILLCTMGFQLFLPAGIMMINSLFGGAAQLKPSHRKLQHFCLQVFAIGCVVSGSAVVFLLGTSEKKLTMHSLTGLASTLLMGCTSLVGPTVYFTDQTKAYGRFNRNAHLILGIPTLVVSTVSFMYGLLKPSFLLWEPVKNLHYILMVFTMIYYAAILYAMQLRLNLSI